MIARVIIEIKPSKVLHGEVGLFAVRNLQSATLIAAAEDIDEVFTPTSEAQKADRKTREKIIAHCTGLKNGFLLPRNKNLNLLPIHWYMNHSCEPNVGFDEDDNFVCLRRVRAGEELVFDYGTLHENPRWRLECKCGSSHCRKIVTGNDWKLPEVQKRYAGHFASHLQKKISALRRRVASA